MAPMQDQFSEEQPPLDELIKNGLGQLTRVFGSRPVPAAAGMRALAGLQARIVASSRFGIPAVAHEECLTGFAAWGATIYPTSLAWGASFDPALVGEMAAAFGATMRAAGVHQGLAPVLDVTRDYRWGRVEETIGEDPYLVGTVGTAYVQGLQSAGLQATLKHFAGYSASRAGRNHAPVSMGPREFADVILPPFEMAIRIGGARSVMPTYIDRDGVPASADPNLLTALLRDELGFDGVVVSDYFAVSFLQLQHRVAADPAGAAALALAAGLDVELPSTRCYGDPLLAAVTAGDVPEELIDRAAARVLRQKLELGLLDPGWSPLPADAERPRPDRGPGPGPGPARAAGHRPAAGRGVGGAARQRPAGAAAAEDGPGRRHRAAGRRPARVLRLLHDAEAPPAPGVVRQRQRGRRRGRHRARRAPRGTPRRRLRARLRRRHRRPERVRRGSRDGPFGRLDCRRGGRPGRPVRARDQRRGVRRDRPHPPRRAAGPAAGAGRHRHAGGGGARHRPAVRARRRWRAAWPPWCRRSSPARRAVTRSPGC